MSSHQPVEASEAREIVRDVLARHVSATDPARWDREEVLPVAALSELAQRGLMGLTIPREYGGRGRDIPAALAVLEELSKTSLALAVPYLMSVCYGGVNIMECGTDEQKQRFLPHLAKGTMSFSFAVTEPAAGSDLGATSTQATLDGSNVVVNGMKQFVNGANVADYIYTLVRSGSPEARYKNLSLLLIPTKAAGISFDKVDSMGMRGGAALFNATFENVLVPRENIVGGEAGWNQGWRLLLGPGLDIEKLEVAAMALGIAEAAVAEAWSYAERREQFGVPISSFQAIRHSLANSKTDLLACRLMLQHAAALAQERKPCGLESSMAKLFICERAREIVIAAQETVGAYACLPGNPIERCARDILLFPIVGGSSSIQRNNIAKQLRLRQ